MHTKSNISEAGANGQGEATDSSALAATGGSAATGEVRSFFADVEDLIRATTSLTGEDLARARAKLGERVAAAKASLEQMGGAIAERTRDGVKATDGYVRQRPWHAVGLVAAVGLLVGFVLARRRA